jgi:hypothetical protein
MQILTTSISRYLGVVCLVLATEATLFGQPSGAAAQVERAPSAAAAPAAPTTAGPAAMGTSPLQPAVVPQLIKFSGTLVNLAGKPIAGPVDVTFALYAAEAGGSPLWFETQTVEADSLGKYTVLLGAMTPTGVPMDLFAAGAARWLGVEVSNLPEQPRVLLVSVPYAMKAGDAETLGGKPASAYQLAPACGGPSADGSSSPISDGRRSALERNTLASGCVRDLAGSPAAGKTTSPTAAGTGKTQRTTPLALSSGPTNFSGATTDQVVSVTQTGSGVGLAATAATNVAVVGTVTSTGGVLFGVKGVSYSSSGAGVQGILNSAAGGGVGVWGETTSTGGRGVYGRASALTGNTQGVQGIVDSTGGTAISGWARATTGATFGIAGDVASTGGTGLRGRAYATSGVTTGILATVSSPSGTGLVINNLSGGKLFSGQNNGAQNISIGADGNVVTNGNIYASGGISTPGGLGAGATSILTAHTYALEVASTEPGGYVFRGEDNNQQQTMSISGGGNLITNGAVEALSGLTGDDGGAGYGAQGNSTTGDGVEGNSNSANGVYGHSSTSHGVFGQSGYLGVLGSGTNYGVYGQSTNYGVYSGGPFAASGTKSAVVALDDNRVVELYATEAPEVWFEDFGTATLKNGVAEVTFDPTYALTVNTQLDYHVFLTPRGDCEGLYVTQQTPGGFQVRGLRGGKSNVSFDYRIVAKRRGFENVRLQEVDADADTVATIRKQNHARSSRPMLKVPKVHARPEAPSAPPNTEAGPPATSLFP